MSYHLTRLRLIETAYQVIYIMNHTPHPPYEAILKIDQEFKEIEKTVSLFFSFPPLFFLSEPITDFRLG